MKQIIIRFLKLNGFERVESNSYVLLSIGKTIGRLMFEILKLEEEE